MRSERARLNAHWADIWMARAAVVVIAGLQMLVVNDLSVGPKWLAPALEVALLVPLSAATAWNQNAVRNATEDREWHRVARQRRWIRRAAILLTIVVTLMNFGALAALVRAMVGGRAGNAQTLLLDALNIWVTNVIAFALWYWNMDRGGPAMRGLVAASRPDFLFPQHTMVNDESCTAWASGFVDYLFVAFTTATAFSPSNALPLSPRAKLLMMAEAGISLVTIAMVASRAVGILQ